MRITKRQLIQIIKEERAALKDMLDHEEAADVIHAMHSAWAGGNAGDTEDENLVLPIDHAVAAGSEPTTKEPEMLPRQENLVSERALRRLIRKKITSVLKESAAEKAMADLPALVKAVERNEREATRAPAGGMMGDMYRDDASQLQHIHDMSKDDLVKMQPPSTSLRNYMSRIDTAVREQIPLNLYNWIVGQG